MKLGNKYLIVSILITFVLLILCTLNGIFIGFPLGLGFVNFAFLAWQRGYSVKEISRISLKGGAKSFLVLRILILVGAITAIWMASGTTPAILYYGMRLIDPKLFVVYVFVISSLVSFLLGTSFGTVSTVGLALILMAKSGNVNADIAAGAIIAGAYFGDRCSPMSSSANLIAHLTETDLYLNIRNMLKTGAIPFALAVLVYLLISLHHPLRFIGNNMADELSKAFNISWIALLPALAILIFATFRVDVKIAMLVSILVAMSISVSVQHYQIMELLKIVLLGFNLQRDSSLRTIIQGGGILSMWKVSVVVFISCSWAGLFAETNILADLEEMLLNVKSRSATLLLTTVLSLVTGILGCSQTISIILTHSLMTKVYAENKIDKYQLAVDLENTCVPLAALIPWNTAAFVPSSTLNVSLTGYIHYAFYLYLIPVVHFLWIKFSSVDRPLLLVK